MNTGAAAAQGEILLFLHVDCSIPPDSLRLYLRHVQTGCLWRGRSPTVSANAGLFLRSLANLSI